MSHVQHYFQQDNWLHTFWAPSGISQRFTLYSVGTPPFEQWRSGIDQRVWQDEAIRERRLFVISDAGKDFELVGRKSRLLGMGPFGKKDKVLVGMLFATAANASSLIPLEAVLDSFERLAAQTPRPTSAELPAKCGLAFAFLVIEHIFEVVRPQDAQEVLRSCGTPQDGRPSMLEVVRNTIDNLCPHALEVYFHDFLEFGHFDDPRDVLRTHAARLLSLARGEAAQRNRTVRQFSPQLKGITLGACLPYKASMLDAYLVAEEWHRTNPDNVPALPLYQPSPSPVSRPGDFEQPNPFHAAARTGGSGSPHVLEQPHASTSQYPALPPPSYSHRQL
ncbi:hypothetical protein JCM8547_002505 [Rhodosporidiobolus lusitaniae]